MHIFFNKFRVFFIVICFGGMTGAWVHAATPLLQKALLQKATQRAARANESPNKDESQALVEVPKVTWDVDWAISRDRPGYPLLNGAKHFSIHRPSIASGVYHHHPQIVYFNNRFVAVWSNHPLGEDGPGQAIIGAISDDGMIWNSLGTIFGPCDDINTSTGNGRSLVASPFLIVDNRLFASATINDGVGYGTFDTPVTSQPLSKTKTGPFEKRIRRPHGYLLREIHPNGTFDPVFWIGRKQPAPKEGFQEFTRPTGLSKSTLDQLKQSMRHPITQSPWDFDSPYSEINARDGSLLCEPTTRVDDRGLMIRYFRDLNNSQKLYVQFSNDQGKSWTLAERTEIPDAPSKSILGRLPDGQFFLIGNQVVSKRGTRRDPLTIGLSKNGTTFDKAFAIRWRTPKFQVPSQQTGPDGRGRGFQYPSYAIANGALWVIYSVNKESIDVSRIDLQELAR